MGKSDKKRAQKTLDTQSQTAQQYLRGVQNQSGNLYNNLSNAYLGPQGTLQPGTATGGNGPYQPTFPGNGSPGRTAPGETDPQAQFKQIMGNTTGTVSNLLAKRGELEAAGYKLIPNATRGPDGQPTNYDLQLPNGEVVDVIKSASTGGGHPWQWGIGQAQTDYGRSLGGTSAPGQGMGGGILQGQLGDYGNLMKQYQGWADTGGLSEQDKANLRNRATSPLRALYARGQQDISRQRSLQGGYSPGATTALTRMNRNMGQGMSDATGNAEAAITQMMQQGKQFGMGGMSGMYGATPGLSNMFGNQVLGALGNQTNLAQLQSQLGNWITQNQIQQGGMQGFPWAKTLGTIGSIAAAIPTGGTSLMALPKLYSAGASGAGAGGFVGGGYI